MKSSGGTRRWRSRDLRVGGMMTDGAGHTGSWAQHTTEGPMAVQHDRKSIGPTLWAYKKNNFPGAVGSSTDDVDKGERALLAGWKIWC